MRTERFVKQSADMMDRTSDLQYFSMCWDTAFMPADENHELEANLVYLMSPSLVWAIP